MQLNFITVDVFTDQQFGGNPLAVVLNGHGLTTEQMQSIAAEFNLAETTFVLPPKGPHHAAEVRIFTPRAELPFAGHPNIGTAFVLATLGNPYGSIISDSLVFEEKAGLVKLDLIRNGTSIIGARLAAPQPLVRSEDIAPDVLASLRGERDLTLQLRIAQGVDMGRPSLLEATAEKRNDRIIGMWIGGKCVAMMRGSLEL